MKNTDLKHLKQLVTGKLTTHFKILYVKDPTCSDNDHNMYLSPVVVANPRPFPSDWSSSERKEVGAYLQLPSIQESKSQGPGI